MPTGTRRTVGSEPGVGRCWRRGHADEPGWLLPALLFLAVAGVGLGVTIVPIVRSAMEPIGAPAHERVELQDPRALTEGLRPERGGPDVSSDGADAEEAEGAEDRPARRRRSALFAGVTPGEAERRAADDRRRVLEEARSAGEAVASMNRAAWPAMCRQLRAQGDLELSDLVISEIEREVSVASPPELPEVYGPVLDSADRASRAWITAYAAYRLSASAARGEGFMDPRTISEIGDVRPRLDALESLAADARRVSSRLGAGRRDVAGALRSINLPAEAADAVLTAFERSAVLRPHRNALEQEARYAESASAVLRELAARWGSWSVGEGVGSAGEARGAVRFVKEEFGAGYRKALAELSRAEAERLAARTELARAAREAIAGGGERRADAAP